MNIAYCTAKELWTEIRIVNTIFTHNKSGHKAKKKRGNRVKFGVAFHPRHRKHVLNITKNMFLVLYYVITVLNVCKHFHWMWDPSLEIKAVHVWCMSCRGWTLDGSFFYSVITILIVIIIVLSALQSIHSPCQLSDVCLAGWMVRADGVGRVGVCADLLISKMCTKRCPDNNLYQLGLCLFTVWLPELTCHLLTVWPCTGWCGGCWSQERYVDTGI